MQKRKYGISVEVALTSFLISPPIWSLGEEGSLSAARLSHNYSSLEAVHSTFRLALVDLSGEGKLQSGDSELTPKGD